MRAREVRLQSSEDLPYSGTPAAFLPQNAAAGWKQLPVPRPSLLRDSAVLAREPTDSSWLPACLMSYFPRQGVKTKGGPGGARRALPAKAPHCLPASRYNSAASVREDCKNAAAAAGPP